MPLYIGTWKDEDPSQPIEWMWMFSYNFPGPRCEFGHIQHGPFIVIFGGKRPFCDELIFTSPEESDLFDDIYILDLRKKSGWIQSPIKCPWKGTYDAVLDELSRNNVHLWKDEGSQHFCIKLTDLFPPNMQQEHAAEMEKQRLVEEAEKTRVDRKRREKAQRLKAEQEKYGHSLRLKDSSIQHRRCCDIIGIPRDAHFSCTH